MPPAVTAAASPFDLDASWQLNPKVSLRPERFGALLYHFGTRRLAFCKNITIATVLQTLTDYPDARAACLAAGVAEPDLRVYQAALASLASSDTIIRRHPAVDPAEVETK